MVAVWKILNKQIRDHLNLPRVLMDYRKAYDRLDHELLAMFYFLNLWFILCINKKLIIKKYVLIVENSLNDILAYVKLNFLFDNFDRCLIKSLKVYFLLNLKYIFF